jgi:hypothetical protein
VDKQDLQILVEVVVVRLLLVELVVMAALVS